MSAFLGAATEPEGRRGSQTQLSEGGRHLDTPENRPAAAATPPRLMAACSRRRRRPAAINPKPSPFFVSHFRGALHWLKNATMLGRANRTRGGRRCAHSGP